MHAVFDQGASSRYGAIIMAAARSWREARDTGHLVQPRLSQALAAFDCAMLAPVLDSLLRFYEAALGRPILSGNAAMASDDELLLLSLVEGSAPRACLDCTADAANALDCAMCSTRIMMALTLGRPTMRALQ